MYNWRFLILALLAALHPISSFSKRNSVDGRRQCCDNEPTSLLRGTRLSYGSLRLWQTTANDKRLDLHRNIPENRRYEIDNSVDRGFIREKRLEDRRPERDNRRVSSEPFRLAQDDMRRVEAHEGDRRQREFTSVKRDSNRITAKDITRLERNRVRDTKTFSTRANNEQNRFSMEFRRESRIPDAHSEFRNQGNRETRDLLQRARNDVMTGVRRDQQIRGDSIRNFRHRISRSLERRDYVETRQLNRNEFRLNRERGSVKDPEYRISRSYDRLETSQEFNRIEFSLNRERGYIRDPEHRMSQSLELRRERRAGDRMTARNELRQSEFRLNRAHDLQNREIRVRDFRPESRVTDVSNQRIAREKRSFNRISSGSIHQTLDLKERRQDAAESLDERRALNSPQDTRGQEEYRSNRQIVNGNDRRAIREMGHNEIQRSRLELRQMDRRLSGQNDERMYERNEEGRRFRPRSLDMNNKRERQSVDRRERERTSVDHVRDEKRVSRINILSSPLADDRRQSVDGRQRERNSVDRVHIVRRKSRPNVQGVRSSLDKNLRQTVDSRQRERDQVNRVHNEKRETRINAGGVRNQFNENQRLSFDHRERDSVDHVRNKRMNSRINLREVQTVRNVDERQSLGRDSVTRAVQNSAHLTETPRTMRIRDVRQESREQRSRESGEPSRYVLLERREIRQSIRNDDRESRALSRGVRTIHDARLADRSVERQISRDSRRDERVNGRRTENTITRNLERDEYRFRSDVRFSENRENFVLQHKTGNTTINWQHLLYTLQAIYLCGIFAKLLSGDKTGKKTRSLQWWTGPFHNLVKVD